MNSKSMKWLNFLLSLIAAIVIYYFLHDTVAPEYRLPLAAGLIILTAMSLIVVLRKEHPDD